MLKRLFQSLFRSFGYTMVCNARFGREPWQDLRALAGDDLAGGTIFDVGAHRGMTLENIKQTFPSALVHCFEPDPDSFAALEEKARAWSGVSLHQMALGDQAGQLPFHRNQESMTNSLLAAAAGVDSGMAALMENKETISVPVSRLDDFCAEAGVERINLLKTDCQGFDFQVLKGASALLADKRIDLIHCEAIFDAEYVGQGYFHEILAFLTEQGYGLCGIYHPARNSRNEITFADATFRVRKQN